MPRVRTRRQNQKPLYAEELSGSEEAAFSSGDEFKPLPKFKSKTRKTARKFKSGRNLGDSTEGGTTSGKKSIPRSNTNYNNKDTYGVSLKSAKIRSNGMEKQSAKLISDASDSSDEDGFEEVSNPPSDSETKAPVSTQKEIEFMSQLFSKAENELVQSEEEVEDIKVSVSTLPRSKSASRDPVTLAALAEARELRQRIRSIHTFHVMGFLTLGRFINRTCDDPDIRALGLSLAKEPEVWDVTALWSLVLTFTSLINPSRGSEILDVREGIQMRLMDGSPSADDCSILMVAALRALGFDSRLVLAFAPPPLKVAKAAKVKPIKTLKPLSRSEKHSSKIISSDSEDEAQVHSRYVIFAEVFLPSDQLWYSLDLSPPIGRVSSEFPLTFFDFPYVVGYSSTEKSYLGRSPIDLAPRYDPAWMSTSRGDRILDSQYEKFLSSMKYHWAGDVRELREKDCNKAEERRDSADAERIFEHLRSLPMPKKVTDFKNHPLYALRRHLLKFEVIYPDDAPVLGFLKVGPKRSETTEPIYPRECVHVAHTREAWLKEAKVVRVGEKPAKVVKAMMTMKRLLLQEQNGTTPMVELFGSWQVDDYVPPVAENGIVPRNEHGNVELFKACMLPVGCVHIRLPGIQYIAKQLQIDIVPAMIGWSFGRAGWAHPEYDGFVVCREVVPALTDAWRAARMNAAAVEAADRTERALANWKRLVKHLFLWQRVKERFELAKSAHVKPALVSVGDLRTALTSKSDEPCSSDWKPLPSAKPVFPRLLEVSDLAEPQRSSRRRRVACESSSKKKKTSSPKRPRLRKRRRRSPAESEDEESEHDDFIQSESD
ncbi:hypothetical protein Aperf_G00000048965 [Anoplocephala perfoliata]